MQKRDPRDGRRWFYGQVLVGFLDRGDKLKFVGEIVVLGLLVLASIKVNDPPWGIPPAVFTVALFAVAILLTMEAAYGVLREDRRLRPEDKRSAERRDFFQRLGSRVGADGAAGFSKEQLVGIVSACSAGMASTGRLQQECGDQLDAIFATAENEGDWYRKTQEFRRWVRATQ